MRKYQTIVPSMLLYGAEIWKIMKRNRLRLETAKWII